MKRMFVFALAMAMVFGVTSFAVAEDAPVTACKDGSTIKITHAGNLTALGCRVFGDVSVLNTEDPANKPAIVKPNDDGTETDIAWIQPPAKVTLTLSKDVDANVVYREGAGDEIEVPVTECD